MVELALILPILLLIVLGLVEFGRALFIYTVVSNAAREGARYGIVHPKDEAGIRDAVYERLILVPSDTVEIDISYDLCETSPCDVDNITEGQTRVVVDVRADFSMITPVISRIFPPTQIGFSSARTIVSGARAHKTPMPPTATPPSACDFPLAGVSVSGPGTGYTGEDLVYTASPSPANASLPIDYTWSTDGLVGGQGTDQATYNWDSGGWKTVRVTARNCGDTPHSDEMQVQITQMQLVVTFMPGYPVRGTERNANKGNIRAKVLVTDQGGTPVLGATVTVDIEGGVLTDPDNDGIYGCWTSASGDYTDRNVTVTATKSGYAPGGAMLNTSVNPHVNYCP